MKLKDKKIAIIGAGISGLVIAKELAKSSEVIIFEKARGVGGRMATRYADPYFFDHGTQCFTARGNEFQRFLEPFLANNIVSQWCGKVVNLEVGRPESERIWREKHFVATPNMNSLCKYLARSLDIKLETEIMPIKHNISNKWDLVDMAGNVYGGFDFIISTAPPAQTIKLFGKYITENNKIYTSNMQPCFALMIGLNKKWERDWIAAKVRNNVIKWISVNSSKPGRDDTVTSLVVHSTAKWAGINIDQDVGLAAGKIFQSLREVLNEEIAPDYSSLHRWKYAIVANSSRTGFFIDENNGLAGSSDWGATSRIEEVYINAVMLCKAFNSL